MRKVLLLEPNYKNKYPPMGLMKLATYYRNRGDDVRFFKGDLRDLAVTLLCEEYMQEVEESRNLAQYWNNFFQYIKTRRNGPIEAVPGFEGTDNAKLLQKYRKRYAEDDYKTFDIICVSTLFTFYWKLTVDTINSAIKFLKIDGHIFVGGIASTLLPEYLLEQTGVAPIKGLISSSGILDVGSDVIIDELPLDYSILEEIDYQYPYSDAYFGYMTRGCVNKCPFCAVPKLEPEYRDFISLKHQIEEADVMYGTKKDLLLLDNNVLASSRFEDIVDEVKECGFERGATYVPPSEYDVALKNLRENRNERAYIKKILKIYDAITDKLPEERQRGEFFIARKKMGLLHPISASVAQILAFDEVARPFYNKYFKKAKRARYIDFNQGLDARLVTEDKMKKLAEINIRPLRIAFDDFAPKLVEQYEKAIRLAAEHGLTDLSNYLLYNYNDEPEELYHRMKMNVELCDELRVTIYSFPMKYHPIDDPEYFHNRDYIGKHWNRKFIRAVQAVLNSTKGKIGKGKEFFEEAFGEDVEEFRKILWMPEAFIIYRRKYDANLRKRLEKRYTSKYEDESNLANEWWDKFTSLNNEQMSKAKEIISVNHFSDEDYDTGDHLVKEVLNYYKIKRK